MPIVRRLCLSLVLLAVAIGLGRLSIVQADPSDLQVWIDPVPSETQSAELLDIALSPPPDIDDLWNLRGIGLPCDPPFEDLTPDVDHDVIVAVVDTGIDDDHPLFAGRLVPGYDMVNHDNDPADDQGHGTHIAGTVALVAPSVKIMPVKVLSAQGRGAHSWITNGVVWAVDHGADVINLSLGGPYTSATMQEAMAYAWSRGVVLAAAAGSGNTSNPTYPAAYDDVMGVTAVTRNGQRASFSNYGPYVTVAAPGIHIISAVRGGDYQAWSGTGPATPHVSALAGLVKVYFPFFTNRQIRAFIEQGADDLGAPGWDPIFGYGRINVCRTLRLAHAASLRPVSTIMPPLPTATPPTE